MPPLSLYPHRAYQHARCTYQTTKPQPSSTHHNPPRGAPPPPPILNPSPDYTSTDTTYHRFYDVEQGPMCPPQQLHAHTVEPLPALPIRLACEATSGQAPRLLSFGTICPLPPTPTTCSWTSPARNLPMKLISILRSPYCTQTQQQSLCPANYPPSMHAPEPTNRYRHPS